MLFKVVREWWRREWKSLEKSYKSNHGFHGESQKNYYSSSSSSPRYLDKDVSIKYYLLACSLCSRLQWNLIYKLGWNLKCIAQLLEQNPWIQNNHHTVFQAHVKKTTNTRLLGENWIFGSVASCSADKGWIFLPWSGILYWPVSPWSLEPAPR